MIELLNTKPSLCAKTVSLLFACHVLFWLCLLAPAIASAQTQPEEPKKTGDLQLSVKVKVNDKQVNLRRKRFYLIKGSFEENKALVDKISQQSLLTRECFYRDVKASEAFIDWLINVVNCESVYCHAIEEKYIAGSSAVPEFQVAYERSVKEYKSPELGRLWLTTNLTNEIRDGYYRQKQAVLKTLVGETSAGATVDLNSVMTDRNGNANFTDLTPGTYLVSNLIPIELGDKSLIWTCQIVIKPREKTALQLPQKIKMCVFKENPLPACDAKKQTASSR